MMSKRNKIRLEFCVPEHGWLPTKFEYGNFILDLEISNVPCDPMVQLCDALIQINKGIRTTEIILWHLEPYCYFLQLEIMNGQYKGIILESDEYDKSPKKTKEIIGDFESIVLPLYRALKNFYSQSYKPPHWEEISFEKMEELTQLIKHKKNQCK